VPNLCPKFKIGSHTYSNFPHMVGDTGIEPVTPTMSITVGKFQIE